MNQYAIYQLPFENEKLRDLFFMNSTEVEDISDEFELVGTVKAGSFEQVFSIGNMDRDRVDTVGPMRSVSVGDILVNIATGETVVVAKFGFDKINMKEAA